MKEFNGIILSAGLSSRMRRPKAMLPYKKHTFLENIYYTFIQVVDRLAVVVSPELYIRLRQKNILLPKAEFVFNQDPLSGRFYSIYLGVSHLGASNIFIHNVDTPGIASKTLEVMKEALVDGAYVVPVYKGNSGHPVLISSEIAQEIINLESYDMNFRKFLMRFNRIEVEVDDEFVVLNVNTPEDLRKLYSNIYNLFGY